MRVACVTFDWVVAAYIAIFYGLGLLTERTPSPLHLPGPYG
jgi:hypothetical protein